MIDKARALSMIIEHYPEFEGFRDVYYGNYDEDRTPLCIDMARLGDYLWEESVKDSSFDYALLRRLVGALIAQGNEYVNYCLDICLIDKLDQRDSETANDALTKRWITAMGPILEERSIYWRAKRKRMPALS